MYLLDFNFDFGIKKDSSIFSPTMKNNDSRKLIDDMNERLKSMDDNGVWDLVEFPNKYKKSSFKWVF